MITLRSRRTLIIGGGLVESCGDHAQVKAHTNYRWGAKKGDSSQYKADPSEETHLFSLSLSMA